MATVERSKEVPHVVKLVFSGMAGILGGVASHPMDVVKSRIQSSGVDGRRNYRGPLEVMIKIIRIEGPAALFNGLSATILRQATYTTARLAVYSHLNETYRNLYQERPTLTMRLYFGLAAGTLASILETPATTALIRMATDADLSPFHRRNYRNVINAIIRISREEGIRALYSAFVPSTLRLVIRNASELTTYSQFKHIFLVDYGMEKGFAVQFYASMISGLVTSIVSLPIDTVSTRVMAQKRRKIHSFTDALVKLVRRNGVRGLWKGFLPFYFKMGPQTVFTLMILERFYQMYFEYVDQPVPDAHL